MRERGVNFMCSRLSGNNRWAEISLPIFPRTELRVGCTIDFMHASSSCQLVFLTPGALLRWYTYTKCGTRGGHDTARHATGRHEVNTYSGRGVRAIHSTCPTFTKKEAPKTTERERFLASKQGTSQQPIASIHERSTSDLQPPITS